MCKKTQEIEMRVSLLFLLLSFTILPMAHAKVEEISYQIIEKQDRFEVREYDSFIKATVTFDKKDDYKSTGFRILFNYISGNNTSNRQIDMTAPVILDEGQNIDMTAPVILDENDNTSKYSISFVMPSSYTLESTPLPNDKRIIIEKVEKSFKAAVTFSGFMWDYKVEKYSKELLSWIELETKYKTISRPVRAGYNSPMTLPFLRRNEILVDVDFK